MVDKREVFLLGFFLLVLFNLQFILAVSLPPTGIIFNGNVTSLYDEGVFTINWTDGGQNSTGNYTIYLWMNGNYVSSTKNANNSALGYAWSNTTEANYTFAISAINKTNHEGVNSSNVSMYVDSTAPLVNWTSSGYSNVTYKKNTAYLTLNISVGDALSGVNSGSYCIFDINDTNETIVVSNGWCNTSYLNLTGLSDGNHSINIWANDTVNNIGVNLSSYVVWIDTTAPPAPTFSCTPTSVYITDTITCSCSGTDASSGVNSTTYTVNPSTANSGTLDTSCIIMDKAGNSISSSISYYVGGVRSSGSSTSSTSVWTNTYTITDNQLNEGFTRELNAKSRIRLNVNEETHYVGIISLTSITAVVNVSSISQQKTMEIEEEWKVEVTGDGYYDLLIKLNKVESNKANITLISISELIEENSNQDSTEIPSSEDILEDQNQKDSSNWWIFVIVGLILLVGIYFLVKNKKIFK